MQLGGNFLCGGRVEKAALPVDKWAMAVDRLCMPPRMGGPSARDTPLGPATAKNTACGFGAVSHSGRMLAGGAKRWPLR